MPDPRFFEDLGPVTLAELAEVTGTVLSNPAMADRLVSGVSVLDGATRETVTFASGKAFVSQLGETRAGACFLTERDSSLAPADCAVLVAASPQRAYALAATRLRRMPQLNPASPWGPASSWAQALRSGADRGLAQTR